MWGCLRVFRLSHRRLLQRKGLSLAIFTGKQENVRSMVRINHLDLGQEKKITITKCRQIDAFYFCTQLGCAHTICPLKCVLEYKKPLSEGKVHKPLFALHTPIRNPPEFVLFCTLV